MSTAEALRVDLGRLAEQADAERDRLHDLLADACARVAPGRAPLEVARELVREHPDGAGVIDTALPAIAVHEVAPGHFSHGRALRRLTSDVRRTLYSAAFIEGWAHYAEELCVEEGFPGGDPRIEIGVWLEALVRVTRQACAIGVHTAGMTVAGAARRFESDTHLAGQAALSEAQRATFDPTYGRYTWGKLELLKLRERARKDWGPGFTLKRFHKALLDLGSPPPGLLGTALERG